MHLLLLPTVNIEVQNTINQSTNILILNQHGSNSPIQVANPFNPSLLSFVNYNQPIRQFSVNTRTQHTNTNILKIIIISEHRFPKTRCTCIRRVSREMSLEHQVTGYTMTYSAVLQKLRHLQSCFRLLNQGQESEQCAYLTK